MKQKGIWGFLFTAEEIFRSLKNSFSKSMVNVASFASPCVFFARFFLRMCFLVRFAKQSSYSQFHIHSFLWFHCDLHMNSWAELDG